MLLSNHFSFVAESLPCAFRGLRRKIIVAPSAKAKTPTTASKTRPPVTLKHLAAVVAEEHQLTKKAGVALLGDLVGLITKHLKKGERIRIAGLGIEAGGTYWGAILQPAKQSRSRQAKRLISGRPRI
jgi:Bacterial DNA-binding protein